MTGPHCVGTPEQAPAAAGTTCKGFKQQGTETSVGGGGQLWNDSGGSDSGREVGKLADMRGAGHNYACASCQWQVQCLITVDKTHIRMRQLPAAGALSDNS